MEYSVFLCIITAIIWVICSCNNICEVSKGYNTSNSNDGAYGYPENYFTADYVNAKKMKGSEDMLTYNCTHFGESNENPLDPYHFFQCTNGLCPLDEDNVADAAFSRNKVFGIFTFFV